MINKMGAIKMNPYILLGIFISLLLLFVTKKKIVEPIIINAIT